MGTDFIAKSLAFHFLTELGFLLIKIDERKLDYFPLTQYMDVLLLLCLCSTQADGGVSATNLNLCLIALE